MPMPKHILKNNREQGKNEDFSFYVTHRQVTNAFQQDLKRRGKQGKTGRYFQEMAEPILTK